MSWIIGNDEGKREYEPIPDGVTYAVCRGVIDLGTHHDERYDKDKRELVIIWELPEYRTEFKKDDETVEGPRLFSKTFNASLNSKASLRKNIESWRGAKFTDEELAVFDIKEIIGEACQLQLQQREGKKYSDIISIMSMPKGVEPPVCEGEFMWFTFDEGGEIPESIPKWIKDQIESSREYQ